MNADVAIWSRLRASRSSPPGLASSGRRQKTFNAALEQCEQLIGAARVSGVASRPMLLHYALTQAGRAVLAARARGESEAFGHGLKSVSAVELRDVTVEPNGAGLFQAVSNATESGALASSVSVSELCAALPELEHHSELTGDAPRAMPLRPHPEGRGMTLISQTAIANVHNFPENLAEADDAETAIAEHLSLYPSAEGWRIPDWGVVVGSGQAGFGPSVVLAWHSDGSTAAERLARLQLVAGPYRHPKSLYLLPGHSGVQVSPLARWWLLLHALSILARYEPARWTAALDVDRSAYAVPLERLLSSALTAIPHLALEAITGQASDVAATDFL